MPIYEYCCTRCNDKFEMLRTISKADDTTNCPKCHGKTQKVISRFSSFSKGHDGASNRIAGTGNSCGSCSATSCSGCH
jgi:putative FmdB family regulatory protein